MYTAPKDYSYYATLSSTPAYEQIMKTNVDVELSFNSWDISIQKTINTSKSALYADTAFLDWGQVYEKDLPCLVRKLE